MPAAVKIEKPASDEMTNGKAKNASNANNGTNHVVSSASMLQEPQKIANSIIEKKIRNLEKRKARLLELKAMEDKGQQLEAEQKIAVKKLENVVEMIDMLKEIGKNVTDGLNEHAKQFKKQQKKEQIEKQAERQQQELERVKFWLYSQLIVAKYLPLDSVKADLEQGKIGEIKIEENQVDAVNKLGDLLAPSNFESVESSVEKLGNLLEGNKREFSTGVSYSDVKELLNQFKESKYFENVSLVVEPVVVSSTESTENVKSLSEESVPSNEPVQADSDVKSEEEPTEANQDVPQNVHHINNQLCFMRDTRVETELQHKDPAVVAVASLGFPYPPQNGQALSTSSGSSANPSYPPPHIYQTVPIQTQTFQNANYSIPANYIPAIPMATHQIPIPDQIAIPRNVAPDAPTIPISNDNSEVSATKVNGQFSPDSPKEASQDAESKPIANGQFDNRGSFPRGRPRGRGGYSRGGNFNNYHRGGRGGGGNPSENKGNFGGHYNNNNGAPQNFNPNNRPANRPRTENGGGNRPYRQDRGVRNQTNQFNDQAAPVSAK